MAKTRKPQVGPQVLLTGATGFVGRALYPALLEAGCRVRCASRRPDDHQKREPDKAWVAFDVERPESMAAALQGVDIVYYLVHSMGLQGGGGDWATREETSAGHFVAAASAAGVKRIVYLGGVVPQGVASKHLRSRLRTGEVLRAGEVPVIELRSGMIIGTGSASWDMVRDLSLRLPFMLLPAWLQYRSQPVSIADVVAALVHAGTKRVKPGCYSLPGPEALTGQQTLQRIAALRGLRARSLRIPLLTPRLSSHWLRLVTRVDISLAKELVLGYTSDLVSTDPSFFDTLGDYQLQSFETAATLALEAERPHLPLSTALMEWAIERFAPWQRL
jgi:uncharacterized protein YbjT (DUF2867 family)